MSNNAKQGDALQQRGGRASNVAWFIRARRDPEWIGRLSGKERERVEKSIEKLEEKFGHRPLLALIVMLEERILRVYPTRSAFVDHVGDKRLTSKPRSDRKIQKGDILHRQLGGRCLGGPEWWLAELIATHCLLPEDNAEQVLEEVARMWCAANGRSPDVKSWPEPFEAASEQLIASFIDPPAGLLPATPPATTITGTGLPQAAPMVAALLDGLPDALLLVDANGTIVTVNSTARQAFDPAGTGLTGQGLLELLPAFDINRLPRLAPGPWVPTEEQPPPTRLTARRTDGTEWRAEVRTMHLADGRVFRELSFEDDAEGPSSYVGNALLMVVVRDLADTQALQGELVRQQRQTEMVLRTVSEGILGVDAAGRIVLVNPAAAATLGYRASELGGQSLHPLVQHSHVDGSPLPYEKTLIAETLRSGKARRQRGQVLWTKDGRQVPVDLSTAPVHDGDQVVGAVVTFAVRQPLKTLAGVASRHTLMMTLMDEALCTSLQDMQAQLEELADTTEQPEAMGPTLRALASEHARLNTLVRDVAEYQRLGSDPGEFRNRTVALDHVVATAVSGAKTLMKEPYAVRFDVSAPDVDLEIDPDRLSQTLTHVIADVAARLSKNDAAAAGPVVPAIRVTATCEPSSETKGGSLLRIEVRGPVTDDSSLHGQLARGLVRLHGWTLLRRITADGVGVNTLEVPSTLPSRTAYRQPTPLWQAPDSTKRPRSPATKPTLEPVVTNGSDGMSGFVSPLPMPSTLASGEPADSGHAFETFIGTPVRAVHTGKITRAEWSRMGYRLTLTLNDDTDITYSFMSSVARVSGDVRAGDVLGRAGAPNPIGGSGRVRNGRLKLTVQAGDGTFAAPVSWLHEHGVAIRRTGTETKIAAPVQRRDAPSTTTMPPSETVLTTRIRINIPGARSMPPIVTRTPLPAYADDSSSTPAEPPQPTARQLLVWPALSTVTEQALRDRGYRTTSVQFKEDIAAQKATDPAALLVDPSVGPITSTGLTSLRQAAVANDIPMLATVGLGYASRDRAYGAEPEYLLAAMAPQDSTLDVPRVLLLEKRAEVATALGSGMRRRGMHVAHASGHENALTLAKQTRPNLMVFALDMLYGTDCRLAETGTMDWLRSSGRLGRTPLVVYTDGFDPWDLRGLASGESVLYLAARSAHPLVQERITDLLTRIST